MNWIQFFSNINRSTDKLTLKFGFFDPAPESALTELKEKFSLTQLPPELEELYRQTDGIDDLLYFAKTEEWIVTGKFLWSVERVIETNTYKRTSATEKRIYNNFDNLFFFADAGNGDLFGFETGNGKFEKADIYVWNHEDDSRERVAPDLKGFVEGWANGSINV